MSRRLLALLVLCGLLLGAAESTDDDCGGEFECCVEACEGSPTHDCEDACREAGSCSVAAPGL